MPEADVSSELMARPRITVTVSEDVYEFLSEWADREERPLANLAAFLLSKAAREYKEHELNHEKTAPLPSNSKGAKQPN